MRLVAHLAKTGEEARPPRVSDHGRPARLGLDMAAWAERKLSSKAATRIIKLAALLLLATALLKMLGSASAAKILAAPDPVLGIQYRSTMIGGALVEIATAGFLFSRAPEALRLLALFWLGLCFCSYHVVLAILDPSAPCPCL